MRFCRPSWKRSRVFLRIILPAAGKCATPGLTRRLIVLYLYAILAWALRPALAIESTEESAVPSFAELEAAGAVVGEIRIDNQNIFDLDDPKENNFIFRLANRLHIRTRPGLIRRSLLFNSGEPLSVRLIEESERLLRANGYLYDAAIRPIAYHDGIVDIEVRTRDTWTIDPGFSFSRAGGANSSGLSLKEYNLLGTGLLIGVSHKSDVDRSGTEFNIGHKHVFGGWTAVDYSSASYDDGKRESFSLDRPFYALDTRWAAGFSASQSDQIESHYTGGTVVGQYRHRQDTAQAYGGWSRGLIDGWTKRYSAGLTYDAHAYETKPALAPPPELPADETLAAPFFRYEVVEDGFRKVRNRDQIGRPEYLEMGLKSQVQLGRALTGLGSTRNLWLYSARVSNGVDLVSDHTLLTALSFSGQYGERGGERQLLSGSARYYVPQGKRTLFFASISGDIYRNPYPSDQLLLGGDNGLRGYPLRYQSGDQRALLTLEERFYTDWYPFRLFRIGGAVFYDVGRAWGGPNENAVNPGWLSDVGFGLRIFSVRAASGHVWHADFAFPLNADPSISSFQFLLKTKSSF